MFDTQVDAPSLTPLERRQGETRQRILEATLRLIRQEGLDRVSWRAIARAVNYSPAGLYEYFNNKDAIVAALAQEGMARLEAALACDPSLALEERLLTLGRAYIRYAHTEPDYFALIFATLPSARRSAEEPAAGAYKRLFDLMLEGIATGAFRVTGSLDAEGMAYGFWSLVHGRASLQRIPLRDFRADFEAVDREAIERFISSLKG